MDIAVSGYGQIVGLGFVANFNLIPTIYSFLFQQTSKRIKMLKSVTEPQLPLLIENTNLIKNSDDLKRFMDILHVTEDIELEVKLFSILAVHLISNNIYKAEIITSNLLYDKIRTILESGSQAKVRVALNFVSALLFSEEEGASRARSLTLHAQRMLRAGGGLAAVANLFASSMLHQETWKALCRCLEECCRDSFENQSYCSHLVPLCVQKCIHGNMDAISTLKSLISNHEYNVRLFFESNGCLIFKREESLMHDSTMQLLSLVIQRAPRDMLTSLINIVVVNLEQYKILYGTQSKIGQWAIINLYHINCRLKSTDGFKTGASIDNNTTIKRKSNTSTNEIAFIKPDDNTTKLIENVMREIQLFSSHNASSHKMPFLGKILSDKTKNKENVPGNMLRHDDKKILHKPPPIFNEMSFSFLLKKQSRDTSAVFESSKKDSSWSAISRTERNSFYIHQESKTSLSRLNEVNSQESIFEDKITVHAYDSLIDFRPTFVSTPKRTTRKDKGMTKSIRSSRSRSQFLRSIHKRNEKHTNYSNKLLNSKTKQDVQDSKQRSMSSRLFDAINDSCTTFVKTVKSIFKPKQKYEKTKEGSTIYNTNNLESSCSYSFTNYMRHRDLLLSNKRITHRNTIGDLKNTELCKTCNDTKSLKRKVMSDSYLKETVTKLKLGINVYGCDFRKISRAMWPRDNYMTPDVLYNLYRKLIVK